MKPHIKLSLPLPSSRVVVCGAPERAALIAKHLQESKCLAQNREYHSYTGLHKGKRVLVTSHGVGAAGAAICFNELIDSGAEVIVRLGTAGGLYDNVGIGDLVVPTAAIRKDGVSALMVPEAYPAVPDLLLTSELIRGLEARKVNARSGIVLTSDLFYPSLLDDQLAFYQKANAIAVEMECSALFVIASLKKARAGALLMLDGNPLKWSEGQYDPESKKIGEATEHAIQVCLDAILK